MSYAATGAILAIEANVGQVRLIKSGHLIKVGMVASYVHLVQYDNAVKVVGRMEINCL